METQYCSFVDSTLENMEAIWVQTFIIARYIKYLSLKIQIRVNFFGKYEDLSCVINIHFHYNNLFIKGKYIFKLNYI